jgi:hypothetical protein
MKDHYDFSKGIKNPYADKILKEGYTIMVHYGNSEEKNNESEYKPLPEELPAFEEYRKQQRQA